MRTRQSSLPILVIMATFAGLVIGQAQGVFDALIPLSLFAIVLFIALRHNPFIPGQIRSDRVRRTLLAVGGFALLIKLFAHFLEISG